MTSPEPDTQPPCFGLHKLFDSGFRHDHQRAKAICADCPLITTCRTTPAPPDFQGTWAGIGYGIHAEHSHRTRPHQHGTSSGYRKHLRLHELPCDDCYTAHSTTQRERGREQRAKGKSA